MTGTTALILYTIISIITLAIISIYMCIYACFCSVAIAAKTDEKASLAKHLKDNSQHLVFTLAFGVIQVTGILFSSNIYMTIVLALLAILPILLIFKGLSFLDKVREGLREIFTIQGTIPLYMYILIFNYYIINILNISSL